MEEEDGVLVPDDILEEANAATFNLLSQKSKDRYIKELEKFRSWMKNRNLNVVTEEVGVAYFNGLLEKYAAPSLGSTFSMLKSTLFVFEKNDISKFKTLFAILTTRKAINLRRQWYSQKEIEKFLNEAPDEIYLLKKMIIVIVMGGCRCNQLVKLKLTDIEYRESILVVNIIETKNYKPRSFVVTGETNFKCLEIYRKYAALRPKILGEERFFLNFRGKCTVQPVGINTISTIPREVAKYLKLKDPHLYKGHSFRRTSATLLANTSAVVATAAPTTVRKFA